MALTVTGNLSPDATGTYASAGTYDGATYYARVPDGDYVIYWNSYAGAWHISDTLSPWPDVYWLGDNEVLGEYPAAGSYAWGTATVSNLVSEIVVQPVPAVLTWSAIRPLARVIVPPAAITWSALPASGSRAKPPPETAALHWMAITPQGAKIARPVPAEASWSAIAPTVSLRTVTVPPAAANWSALPPAGIVVPIVSLAPLAWSAALPSVVRVARPAPAVLAWTALAVERVVVPDAAPLAWSALVPQVFRGRYRLEARGLYRIFGPAVYRLYRSNVRPPAEGDPIWTTAAALPVTPADNFADGTWWIAVSRFNGVLDSGLLVLGDDGETYRKLVISSGQAGGEPPPGPLDWQLEAAAGGVVRVVALLYAAVEGEVALGYTTAGSDPPAGSPSITAPIAAGISAWQYELAAQAHGTTVKARLEIRRNDGTPESPSWLYSPSVVKSITADSIGPAAPLAGVGWSRPTWKGP